MEDTPHSQSPRQPAVCRLPLGLCLADTSHVRGVTQYLSSCGWLPSFPEHVSKMHPCWGVCPRSVPFRNSWLDVRIHQLIVGFLTCHHPVLNTYMTVLCGPKHICADLMGTNSLRLLHWNLLWHGPSEWFSEAGVLFIFPTRNSGLRMVGRHA